MKKISIVGVEGSGKTVLLSAIGDKYENPDASGVFLSPENERAFGFTTMHMHAMRSGQWPVATTANSNLDWTLFRKTDGRNEEICRLSLLDFAGEAYRLCFGEHSEEETDNWADVLAALKDHIAQSDLLIVIVNLSDVINASPTDPRSRETKWLTKSVIDYASRNGNSKDVAIVFSQADVYKSEIEACGGNEAALRKYLPHVANVYGNLPVLAVSAINKTRPDDITGKAVPAKDFDSEGIDELMEWIISKMPGYADFAQEMAELRLAPIYLWQEARDLYAQYLASLTLSTAERYSIACALQKKLLELRAASEKSPKNAPAQGDLLPLEEKALAIFDFETKAKEVMSLVTYSSKAAALRRLEEYAQKDQRISMEKQHLEKEIDGMFAKLKGEHSVSVRKGLITVAFLIVGIVGLATAGWFYHVKKEKQLAMEIARQQAAERQEQERLRKERELELARRQAAERQEQERLHKELEERKKVEQIAVEKKNKKNKEKLAKEAFAKGELEKGFDIGAGLGLKNITDPMVAYYMGICHLPKDYLPKHFIRTSYPKEKSFEEAYRWLNLTIELKSKFGGGAIQYLLGDMIMSGKCGVINKDEAIELYQNSAAQNFYEGCFALGKCYEDGMIADGNDRLTSATNWYFKAISNARIVEDKIYAYDAYNRVLKEIKKMMAIEASDLRFRLLGVWLGDVKIVTSSTGRENKVDYGTTMFHFRTNDVLFCSRTINDEKTTQIGKWSVENGSVVTVFPTSQGQTRRHVYDLLWHNSTKIELKHADLVSYEKELTERLCDRELIASAKYNEKGDLNVVLCRKTSQDDCAVQTIISQSAVRLIKVKE